VAEFLSEAWIAAFGTAVAAVPRMVDDTETFVVEQRVTGGPRGDACYHIVFAVDRIDVQNGAAPRPDVTLITDFATAVALHRGEMNAQRSIADGSMKVRGAFDALLRHAETFSTLGDAFGELRASTSWPTSPTAAPSASTGAETSR
jgi:hypothetical protein